MRSSTTANATQKSLSASSPISRNRENRVLYRRNTDRLTISPDLLQQLQASDGPVNRVLVPEGQSRKIEISKLDEKEFRFQMNQDAMATEKLSEGIRGFVADIAALESELEGKIQLMD